MTFEQNKDKYEGEFSFDVFHGQGIHDHRHTAW